MSDEESFVILGTSPNSLTNDNSLEISMSSINKYMLQSNTVEMLTESQQQQQQMENIQNQNSINDAAAEKKCLQTSQLSNGNLKSMSSSGDSAKNTILQNSTAAAVASNDCAPSLAASFIMGEVSADVLKTSIYSQLPSGTSLEFCAEDAAKIQNFMAENMELKATLASVNATMKLFYEKTQQRIEEQQRMEREYKQQMQEMQREIATLRNENLELKRAVETKMEQMKLTEELYQKDQMELTKSLSEKSAQIENMRVVINKLEQSQLASFEYMPKNEHDSKEQPDYVDRLEHERVVKDLKREMSVLLAENLDLKDVQQQYIDELTCLKVNLTAAEELIKQSQADINLLKAKDTERAELFTNYEEERNAMKSELIVLREQVDVYSKDFEMERAARENIAGEKDRLLQDLRVLQQKNQKLISEAQTRWEQIEKAATAANASALSNSTTSVSSGISASSVSAAQASSNAFKADLSAHKFAANANQRPIRVLPGSDDKELRCPICLKTFGLLNVLENHVNACLDSN